jgi:hypothetical protein
MYVQVNARRQAAKNSSSHSRPNAETINTLLCVHSVIPLSAEESKKQTTAENEYEKAVHENRKRNEEMETKLKV